MPSNPFWTGTWATGRRLSEIVRGKNHLKKNSEAAGHRAETPHLKLFAAASETTRTPQTNLCTCRACMDRQWPTASLAALHCITHPGACDARQSTSRLLFHKVVVHLSRAFWVAAICACPVRANTITHTTFASPVNKEPPGPN